MPKKFAKKPQQTNVKKIGEATARKMKDKLEALKSQKKARPDEDIHSADSGDEAPHKENFLVGMTNDDDEEFKDKETAEEKRLRMTKQIIKEYAAEDKDDFFSTLQAKTTADNDIMQADDDMLTKRMKMQMLEQKGKLFYKLADQFCGNTAWEMDEQSPEHIIDTDQVFMKGHK